MASVSDTAGASRGQRAAGSGIELAGDRSAGRGHAARHTRVVRILKFTLPLSAMTITAGYALLVVGASGWGKVLPGLDIPKIVADNLAMENPHYEGFNKDGGRYWVTAKKAMQDLKNLALINLDTITGELIDANKERTKLAAARGTFNNKASALELYDAIDVTGDNGMKAHLTRASINTKDAVISSDEAVSVTMPAGTITANQMTVHQKTKIYAFVNDVKASLKARPVETTASTGTAAQQGGFGNPNQAIEIASSRLDVNDESKTALFTGDVTAVQGSSSLTSPELEVSYEGSPMPAPEKDGKETKDAKVAAGKENKDKDAKDATAAVPQAASASDDHGGNQGGKVKRVVAKNPVVLTEADGQKVTGRSAEFDTIAQKAIVEGDVVLTQVPDRRAAGDRIEFDQAANTILLTGPVVVSQGQNEMKGRRLFYNRTTAKMNLTGGAGNGNGRIGARFSQSHPKPANGQKPDTPTRGVAFGGNFKTDPNAPIDVAAERLDVDDQAKQAVFTGDVRALQAGFQLHSSELTATYTGAAGMASADAKGGSQEAAKLTRIQAKKNVEVTSKDGQKATGDWADYDTRANIVTLGGEVVMTQGKNVVRGTKLVIDMTTGESVISTEPGARGGQPMISSSEGDGSGIIVKSGRPSAVFYPNELKEKAEKAAPAVTGTDKPGSGWQSRGQPSP